MENRLEISFHILGCEPDISGCNPIKRYLEEFGYRLRATRLASAWPAMEEHNQSRAS